MSSLSAATDSGPNMGDPIDFRAIFGGDGSSYKALQEGLLLNANYAVMRIRDLFTNDPTQDCAVCCEPLNSRDVQQFFTGPYRDEDSVVFGQCSGCSAEQVFHTACSIQIAASKGLSHTKAFCCYICTQVLHCAATFHPSTFEP